MSFIKINDGDNVAVALLPLSKGSSQAGVTLVDDIAGGHKFALADIPGGAEVIKYGCVIGRAVRDIPAGGHVHTHNLSTALTSRQEYKYEPLPLKAVRPRNIKVSVYPRADGQAGIRNEIWVVPTVGCVNSQARQIANAFSEEAADIDGVFAFTHPFGCSQTGCDHERTRKILQNIVRHPNAGGVLVLGLGCENNRIEEFRAGLGEYDTARIKFLNAQDAVDEIAEGIRLLREIYSVVREDKRVERDIGCLNIGLKCGGSDGLSGITANPLLGMFCDVHTASGGAAVLTEVPEMFGAEQLLMNRARDEGVFREIVRLINDFKDYYTSNGQEVYENPSPGNKDGGISTLEDKSLGCTQKAGTGAVCGVIAEDGVITERGLSLQNGPGNDIVAVTNLGAAGCHMILFTTGRGTPVGGFVPTVKVSTNDGLAARKPGWIDFNAGRVLNEGFEPVLEELIELVRRIANGEKTRNETGDSREISIFKTGVTL